MVFSGRAGQHSVGNEAVMWILPYSRLQTRWEVLPCPQVALCQFVDLLDDGDDGKGTLDHSRMGLSDLQYSWGVDREPMLKS